MTMEKLWLISQGPEHRTSPGVFYTKEAAIEKARDYAECNPGFSYYVCEVVGGFVSALSQFIEVDG